MIPIMSSWMPPTSSTTMMVKVHPLTTWAGKKIRRTRA